MSTTTLRRIQKISLQVVMVGSKAVNFVLFCFIFISIWILSVVLLPISALQSAFVFFILNILLSSTKSAVSLLSPTFQCFFMNMLNKTGLVTKTDGVQLQEPLIYCFPSSEHLLVQNILLMVWLLSFTKILVRDLVRSFLESKVGSVKWVSFISVDPFKRARELGVRTQES